MRKTLIAILVAAVFLGTSIRPAHGFWHHWHQCCATSGYYYPYAVQQAPAQDAPSAKVVEILLPILGDVLKSRIPSLLPPDKLDSSGVKSEIEKIAASLENTNTTLRRHGEEIVNLRLDVATVKDSVEKMKGSVESVQSSVGSQGIQQQINTIIQRLPKRTEADLTADLNGKDLFESVNAQNKLTLAERAAIVSQQKKEIDKILKRHYGH